MGRLVAYYRRTGSWATQRATWEDPNLPGYATVHKHYGGLRGASIHWQLLEYVRTHGVWPTRKDLEKNPSLPSLADVDRYLGGLEREHRAITVDLNVSPPPLSASAETAGRTWFPVHS